MPLVVALVLVAVVAKFFWLLVGVGAAVAVARVVGAWWRQRDEAVLARRRAEAELCARADRQHAAVLAGDEWGVYGDYAPVATAQRDLCPDTLR